MLLGNDTVVIHEITELHPYEMELLKAMRTKWRFGEIVIMVRDGLPFRIKRVEEFKDLTRDTSGVKL